MFWMVLREQHCIPEFASVAARLAGGSGINDASAGKPDC